MIENLIQFALRQRLFMLLLVVLLAVAVGTTVYLLRLPTSDRVAVNEEQT